jgi:hypothetical protein
MEIILLKRRPNREKTTVHFNKNVVMFVRRKEFAGHCLSFVAGIFLLISRKAYGTPGGRVKKKGLTAGPGRIMLILDGEETSFPGSRFGGTNVLPGRHESNVR